MRKHRSETEQAITMSRVTAARKLQAHRPKAQESIKPYNRTKEKRRWHKDQEGAFSVLIRSAYAA